MPFLQDWEDHDLYLGVDDGEMSFRGQDQATRLGLGDVGAGLVNVGGLERGVVFMIS